MATKAFLQLSSIMDRTINWCTGRQVLKDLPSGKYITSVSPVLVADFIRGVASTLTTIKFVVSDEAEGLRVAVDVKMCRIALDNAATNAAVHGGGGVIKFGATFNPRGTK